jgi:hypothetical protein
MLTKKSLNKGNAPESSVMIMSSTYKRVLMLAEKLAAVTTEVKRSNKVSGVCLRP